MSNRKFFVWAGVVVVVAAAGASGLTLWRDRAAPTATSKAVSSARGSMAITPLDQGEQLGATRLYSLDYASTVGQDGGETFAVSLKGQWSITRIQQTPTVALERASFEGTCSVNGGVKAEPVAVQAELEQGFKAPFYLRYSSEGSLEELRFGKQSPRLVQTTWRAVAATAQFVRGEGDQWSAHEHDAGGEYVAHYQRLDQNAAKQKGDYVVPVDTSLVQKVLAYRAAFHFSPQGRLTSLTADEQDSVRSTSLPLPEYKAVTHLELGLIANTSGTAAVAGWLAEAQVADAMGVSTAGTERARQHDFDEARVKGRTLQELLAPLHPEKGLAYGDLKAFSALVSYVRLHPEAVATLLQHIDSHGPLTTTLISALRDAGSVEAQAALRGLLEKSGFSQGDRLQIARGLSRVAEPSVETVDKLRALKDDPQLGAQAKYGLGGNAYRLKGTDPAAAGGIVNELGGLLAAAQSDTERIDYLLALGNSGVDQALQYIEPYLAHPTELVREAAVDALRRLPGTRPDELIADALLHGSPLMRAAAAKAARERLFTDVLAAALATALASETEMQNKLVLIQSAGEWWQRSAAVRLALEALARSDTDPTVRKLAHEAVTATG